MSFTHSLWLSRFYNTNFLDLNQEYEICCECGEVIPLDKLKDHPIFCSDQESFASEQKNEAVKK